MAKRDKLANLLSGAVKQKTESESQIKAKIHIEDEFRDLIPPLKEDEFSQLAQNIADEGCREPLVVWKVPHDAKDELAGKYVLIDGHNRHKICTTYNVDFKIHLVQFKTRFEARNWMINNQLGRRNLSKEQQAFLRGSRYNSEKSQGQRTDLSSDGKPKESTAKRIAKEYNVDEKTIRRDAKFAEGMDIIGKSNPELKQEILKGKVKVNKSHVQKLGEVAKDSDEVPILSVEDIYKRATEIEEGKEEQAFQTKDVSTPRYTSEQVNAQIEHYHASIKKALELAIKNRDQLALSKIKADLNQLEKLLFNN
jgi:hypothetical protein